MDGRRCDQTVRKRAFTVLSILIKVFCELTTIGKYFDMDGGTVAPVSSDVYTKKDATPA